MDQTQQLEDCFLEEEDEVEEELNCGEERQPLAKLRVFKNEHFPETELPLFLGDNVLGRDPSSCTVPLSARSVSKRHAIISLSLLRGSGGCEEVMEALLWDLGSMNGTRRGRFRLTPHVRYALSEGDSVVLADLPCQYICMREEQAGGRLEEPAVTEAQRGRGKPTEEQRKGGKEATSNRLRANALPKEEIPAQLNVTESSSDSEEEIIGIRKSRAKILDSSQDSGPTCSTLLFPASETVPESEDESCITPSSSVRLAHSVSGKTPTYVSDSEPEMDTEAEASKHEPVPRLDQHGHSGANKENVEPSRASEPVRSRKDQMKSSSHNSDRDPDVEGEEGAGDLPGSVCGNSASGTGRGEPSQGADVQHSEFNMDSDTDVEDEGNRVTVSAPDKNAGPIPAVQPTEFHLDSDTDVEGEEGTGDLPGPTCGNATSSTNRGEPLQGPNVQRTEFNMDSDTDVEDEGNGVTASEPGPSAGPVPSIKPVESLDSGRDVEESSEDPSGMSPRCNSGAGQANVKPQKLCFDSCVDAEDAKVKALVPTAAAVNALEILSDSDTDVEEELEPTPCSNTQAAIPSTAPAMSTACLQPDSDTDVEEGEPVKHQPAAKAEVDPKDFNMGSDTDVEDEAGQGTPKRPAGPGCSTPLEQALQEEMETQAFLDTSDPFRRPQIPPLLKPRPLDDSQDDSAEDDLVIAATQCYVPEGGKGSPAVDPALEATQPFAMDPSPAENMEDEPTQAFSFQLGLSIGSECTQPIGQVDSEAESELQATQAYGEAPLRGNTVEMDADPGHGSHIGISETQPIATWEMGAREGEQEEAEAVEEEEWKGRGRRHKGKLPSGKEAREKKKRLEKEERERVEREKWEKVREKKEKERLEQVRKEQKEKERLESEKKEREEKERLEREKREEEERERKENERKEKEREMLEKEQKEQEERERLENEKKEREKTEWLEKEKKEREEKERLEKEKRENEERQREENERKERERERLEKERKEQEERLDNEKKERLEKEEKEREEQKRLEREKREEEERQRKENERKERERERLEKERKEQEERERLELEKKEREEKERLEKEVKEREEKERLEKEKREEEERQRKEKERKERERMEKERKEQEERESLENEKKEREEKERLEKEQKERQEKERKEHEKERLEKEQERKEQEERESLEAGGETAPRRGRRSRSNSISSVTSEQSNCSSTGAQGRGRGRGRRSQRKIGPQTNSVPLSNKSEEPPGPKPGGRGRRSMKEGSSGATDTETDLKATLPTSDGTASTRGRRVIGKDSAVTEEDQTMETMETPVPKASSRGRARGRKVNDCNSTAAEEDLATETVETQSAASSGPKSNSRVRGRGRKMNDSDSETAEVDQTTENVETSNTETSSYNEIGRGNKVSDSDSMTAEVGQTTENVETSSVATVVPKTNSRARGRGRKVMVHDSRVVGGDQTTESVETQSVSAVSTPVPKASSKVRARGRKLSDSNSTAAEVDQTSEIVETPSVTAPAPEANSRGRGQIVENLDSTAAEVDQTTNDVETSSVDGTAPRANTRVKGRGRKVTMSDSASAEIDKETPEGVGTSEEMVPTKSRGRAKGQKRALEVETEEVDGTFKVPRGKSERDGRGEEKEEEGIEINEPSPSPKQRRVTAKQGKTIDPKKEAVKDKVENEEALKNSEDQDAPQTPTGRNSRKRLAPIESPPSAKTPRRSVACAPSPGTGAKSKAVAPKVLFTCVTDEAGEAVVARLGGSMAKGVNDMTHLVTDKVRRTVKFLCAMARGVPIVTTAWLEKSGKSGSFLSPSAYLVKDKEQEKRFNFSLEESLRSACTQPLLQGYEIHVTRSVMPEPAQMKDIISSSGARYLPKMPSVSKPQTVVIACVEDASLCAPALSASIPVVSAEFLLTGILQQRVDLVAHALSGPGFEAGAKGGAKRKRK